MKKHLAQSFSLIALSLLLVGCGNSNSNQNSNSEKDVKTTQGSKNKQKKLVARIESDGDKAKGSNSSNLIYKLKIYSSKKVNIAINDDHSKWVNNGKSIIKKIDEGKTNIDIPVQMDDDTSSVSTDVSVKDSKGTSKSFVIQIKNGSTSFGEKQKSRAAAVSSAKESFAKASSMAESSSIESEHAAAVSEEKAAKEARSSEQKIADNLPKNVLYGYRDTNDSKKNKDDVWVIASRDYVKLWTGEHRIITSMKLDFRDTPLIPDDPDNKEYVTDNTAKDAVQTADLGNDKYLYHSNKYNLDYQVSFIKNTNGDITFIQIFPKQ